MTGRLCRRRFAATEAEEGAIEVVVFNVGANVPMSVLETDSRRFRKIWEMACFGGFLTGREAARYMKPRGTGSLRRMSLPGSTCSSTSSRAVPGPSRWMCDPG